MRSIIDAVSGLFVLGRQENSWLRTVSKRIREHWLFFWPIVLKKVSAMSTWSLAGVVQINPKWTTSGRRTPGNFRSPDKMYNSDNRFCTLQNTSRVLLDTVGYFTKAASFPTTLFRFFNALIASVFLGLRPLRDFIQTQLGSESGLGKYTPGSSTVLAFRETWHFYRASGTRQCFKF